MNPFTENPFTENPFTDTEAKEYADEVIEELEKDRSRQKTSDLLNNYYDPAEKIPKEEFYENKRYINKEFQCVGDGEDAVYVRTLKATNSTLPESFPFEDPNSTKEEVQKELVIILNGIG